MLSVTQVNGGWSTSDLIFVSYNTKTTFNIGDIVNVYGDVSGSYNLHISFTGRVNTSQITARYIELAPNTVPQLLLFHSQASTNNSNNTTNTSGTANPTHMSNSTNPSNIQPIQIHNEIFLIGPAEKKVVFGYLILEKI